MNRRAGPSASRHWDSIADGRTSFSSCYYDRDQSLTSLVLSLSLLLRLFLFALILSFYDRLKLRNGDRFCIKERLLPLSSQAVNMSPPIAFRPSRASVAVQALGSHHGSHPDMDKINLFFRSPTARNQRSEEWRGFALTLQPVARMAARCARAQGMILGYEYRAVARPMSTGGITDCRTFLGSGAVVTTRWREMLEEQQ